ncbi:MAG: hypothetical protein LR017_02635 [Candidatus Pacebacteria bacterium]|nr:hypothetical protein [Candidatus Paceibacterota bacterium]
MQKSLTPEELKAISIEKNEADATVTITGEIPYAHLESYRADALKKLGAHVEIDGFRKGHVPEKMLIEHIGEMQLLGEMAERALAKVYPQVITEHKLEVIGYPQINLTKLAKDNPLGFTATVAVVPEFDLPKYTEIAADMNKNKESKEVSDEEVAQKIEEIQRQKMAYERMQQKAQPKEDGEKTTDEAPIETEEDFKKLPLPELTDDYVQTLGQPGQFETVEDFKKKLREHLTIEKDRDVDAKHRAKITDAIIEKTEVTLPQVLIDAEINQMLAQMEDDLTRAELNMEEYLTHIKKTKEDLVHDWKPAAEKRAKLQLVLNAITEKEGITPKKEDIDQQVANLTKQHKDADEARVRIYVASVLANEEVMKMLEAA